ncbi:MAG: hypothetical protein KAX56_10900 [Phenylobacterium sp.]|nr:hypothetical protein [Phenylobacterium sp.]
MIDPRTRKLRRQSLIGLGGLVTLGLLMVLLGRVQGVERPVRIFGATALVSVIVVWWAVFAIRIYRAQDEYLRQAERVAWYWGGLFGLLVSFPAFIFIGMGGLTWLWPAIETSPGLGRAFALGYTLPLALQVTGALAVGLWWRARR